MPKSTNNELDEKKTSFFFHFSIFLRTFASAKAWKASTSAFFTGLVAQLVRATDS